MSRFLAVLPLLAACGADPYQVYQIAASSGEQGAGCFEDEEIPDDVADDDSTYRIGDTFVIFTAPEDEYYLQLSTGGSIPGTRDGKVYQFSADSFDVSYIDYNPDSDRDDVTLSTTQSTEIKLTVDGRNVSGTSESIFAVECDGENCIDDTSCKTTNDFVGVKVNADVEYVIGSAAN